ncbi:accessory gland-specific peptide 57Dc [Drosophila sechellia]|uniref:GM10214 n=1 Tax=Drosophila sechellia TaxID=7238 RepID=B4ICE4_DROSE|nr:accessory gland-specific peptide 57Dc [Drosophila sechellia]EDW45040.1 GM10214 [Drosophila sechellia]
MPINYLISCYLNQLQGLSIVSIHQVAKMHGTHFLILLLLCGVLGSNGTTPDTINATNAERSMHNMLRCLKKNEPIVKFRKLTLPPNCTRYVSAVVENWKPEGV